MAPRIEKNHEGWFRARETAVLPGGKSMCERIGIVTGGAGGTSPKKFELPWEFLEHPTGLYWPWAGFSTAASRP